MKFPTFAGHSLIDFVKSAKKIGTAEAGDGTRLTIYGTEVAAPEECPNGKCTGKAKARLRRNGSYARQVIEGVVWVIIRILRFRCGSCGGTVSRPYTFLVPHRRYSARVICKSVEQYAEPGGIPKKVDAKFLTSYRNVSIDLSVYDGCEEPSCGANPDDEERLPEEAVVSKDRCCPVRTTVFSWVDFVCKRIMKTAQRVEKELVLRGVAPSALPNEAGFVSKNAWKAGMLERYKHQKNKRQELNKLSYGLGLARLLLPEGRRVVEDLRTYFLQFAEKCVDILSDTAQVLPITQSSGQPDSRRF